MNSFLGKRLDKDRYLQARPSKLYFQKGRLYNIRVDGNLGNLIGEV
jgi:hypothetical protein